MRERINGLHNAFEFAGTDLVDHQRQNNRNREFKDQTAQADLNRVFKGPVKIGVFKNTDKVIKTVIFRPRASRDTQSKVKILKCKLNAVHWVVVKNQQQHQHGKKHDIQPFVLPDLLACCQRTRKPFSFLCPFCGFLHRKSPLK